MNLNTQYPKTAYPTASIKSQGISISTPHHYYKLLAVGYVCQNEAQTTPTEGQGKAPPCFYVCQYIITHRGED